MKQHNGTANDAGRLNNKVALVTGAAMGFGQAMSELFASEGAKVVVADINQEAGEETVTRISDQGGESVFFPMDVRKESDAEGAVKVCTEEFGQLDILV
ncbi:MAG: SDR family NAD(P)-dependent oxidoreductase, partial [Anaerolineales bacterium]|nr:SDR family NAD(P)-dependent oxidoreductase [Anaerolineales bacterium]